MKQSLTLALLLSATMSAQAQFITLRDEGGNVVNGTMITHHGNANEVVMGVGVLATLNGNDALNVNVRRYELNVQPGTGNYFCWGVCYGAVDAGDLPVWQAQQVHSIDMAPGVEVSNHHAYHEPREVVGSSIYRYVWFNTADQSDTVWVDIEFHSMAVGIEEQASGVRSMAIYPNPSQGNDVQFQIE
ncbi:MAG: hypothetical protein KDB84_08920, partial [Flavobacteriales bacterium]|nr:hypothetical protein [Flavobacteriales bacterium]